MMKVLMRCMALINRATTTQLPEHGPPVSAMVYLRAQGSGITPSA